MQKINFCPVCASSVQIVVIDNIERIACSSEACNFIHYGNPVPVVAAVVELDNKFVIARNALWPEDYFSMITGFLERNESPEEAVLREVAEELGLKGEIKTFIGHFPLYVYNQLIIAYWIKAEGTINLSEELNAFRYLTFEEAGTHDFSPLLLTNAVFRQVYTLHSNTLKTKI